ncbi:hypothetical protein [Methylobacterium fujisawaense]|uniref:hypothetical protein n=1 Tax=Methylobacterium fujisawaense TaxID=107400 RepID=UPI0036F6D793
MLKIALTEFLENAMNWDDKRRDKVPTVKQSLLILAVGVVVCGLIYGGLYSWGLAKIGIANAGR